MHQASSSAGTGSRKARVAKALCTREHTSAPRACLVLTPLLALLLTGCIAHRFTRQGADREVYDLLKSRRHEVPEVAGTLDIEVRQRLAEAARKKERFRLGLKDALALATVASRDYRLQREDVYLAALDLTRELNEFSPSFSLGGSADLAVDEDGATFDGDLDAGLSTAFEVGGSLVLGIATNILRSLTGDPLNVAQSILNADVVLPLARGSGRLVAREQLLQAERDVLYALRSYARFQQEFTVAIASRFYRALQLRDSWQNAELAYKSLERLVAEQNEKAKAGWVAEFEVDQARQSRLEADDSRQRAENRYDNVLDQLKLDLGIPVAVDLELDDADLESLRAAGLASPPYGSDEGLDTALARRLDLRNGRDQEVDAQRRVHVARDGLGPQVDLRLGGDLRTPGEKPFDLRRATGAANIGLDLDLPVERTNERNAYRRALIQAARATRSRERLEDLVVLEVRDAFRNLQEARRSYEIQEEGAALAERRVESTQLLLEDGTASIRDRLEAEDARIRARDAVTAALVDHVLARLAVERDVGTLRVDARGSWQAPSAAAPTAQAAPGTPPEVRASSLQGTSAAAASSPEAQATQPAPASADSALPPPQVRPRGARTVGTR